jgi:hypothetical protein
VSSALGCHDDQDIRQALVKDEAIIADLLRDTVNSVDEKRKVLALQGDQAENFLNLIQNVRMYQTTSQRLTQGTS